MTAIIIPRRHYTQPQGRVSIDSNNPASRDIVIAALGGVDVVNGAPALTLGGVSEALPDGIARSFSGAQYDAYSGLDGSYTYVSEYTIAGLWQRRGAATQRIASMGFQSGVRGAALSLSADGSVRAIAAIPSVGNTIIGTPISAARTKYFSAVVHGGGKLRLNHRGVYTDEIDSPHALFNAKPEFRVGADSVPSSFLTGSVLLAAFWLRALEEEELRSLNNNPWQLFRADPVRIYSLPSSGTEQALAASGTATASATAQLAASIALAGVGVALASGSGTLSGAQSAPIAADGAATAAGSAAPRIDIALSAMGLAVATGTATPDAATAGSLAASGAATATGSAGPVASVTISAAGLAQAAATAGLSADILRAGAGAAQAAGNAALAAQLAALAQGAAQASGTAAITGSEAGQLAAYGSAQALGSAALTLQVRLEVTGRAQAQGAATLDTGSAGELAGSGSAQAQGAAQVAATVVLTGAGFAQAMGVGYLVVQVDLAAMGSVQAAGSAAPVDAEALVLISMARWRVDAAGRRFAVDAAGRRYEVWA